MRRLVGPAGHLDWMRASIGALVGIGLTGAIGKAWLGDATGLPFIFVPLAASSVLLFAVPSSPLVRPWALFGGVVISTLVGIGIAKLGLDPVVGGALAVGLSIAVMRACRCLHPPGGSSALVPVLGGSAIHAAGWSFALMPVALNAAVLLVVGWLFNNALGLRYPHRPPVPVLPQPGHYSRADIDAVLDRSPELYDISADDLEQLFRDVEAEAAARAPRGA